jgi:hypothetical protein
MTEEQKPKRKSAVRKDPEAHRQKVKDANRARYAAVARLIAAHRVEFDAYYVMFAEPLGVTPTPSRVVRRTERIRQLEQELADLRGES